MREALLQTAVRFDFRSGTGPETLEEIAVAHAEAAGLVDLEAAEAMDYRTVSMPLMQVMIWGTADLLHPDVTDVRASWDWTYLEQLCGRLLTVRMNFLSSQDVALSSLLPGSLGHEATKALVVVAPARARVFLEQTKFIKNLIDIPERVIDVDATVEGENEYHSHKLDEGVFITCPGTAYVDLRVSLRLAADPAACVHVIIQAKHTSTNRTLSVKDVAEWHAAVKAATVQWRKGADRSRMGHGPNSIRRRRAAVAANPCTAPCAPRTAKWRCLSSALRRMKSTPVTRVPSGTPARPPISTRRTASTMPSSTGWRPASAKSVTVTTAAWVKTQGVPHPRAVRVMVGQLAASLPPTPPPRHRRPPARRQLLRRDDHRRPRRLCQAGELGGIPRHRPPGGRVGGGRRRRVDHGVLSPSAAAAVTAAAGTGAGASRRHSRRKPAKPHPPASPSAARSATASAATSDASVEAGKVAFPPPRRRAADHRRDGCTARPLAAARSARRLPPSRRWPSPARPPR